MCLPEESIGSLFAGRAAIFHGSDSKTAHAELRQLFAKLNGKSQLRRAEEVLA